MKDIGRRLGRGRIGEVDDGCNCVVIIDGGYVMTECESNQSDEISMSAMVTMNDSNKKERVCV